MKKRVLVVEDERMLADMYADKLKRAGFDVVSADNAQDGIAKAESPHPDLILLDILLGEENGLRVLEAISKKGEHIPVIVFSNFDDAGTKEKALRLGAATYLIKTDYTPQQIVEEVKRCMKGG